MLNTKLKLAMFFFLYLGITKKTERGKRELNENILKSISPQRHCRQGFIKSHDE